MLAQEQVQGLDNKELGQQESQKRSHKKMECLEEMSDFIDERMRKDISDISREISQAHDSYNDAEELPIGEAVANVANGWLESIKNAKKKNVILSIPLNHERGSAIIDSLIYRLNHLTNKDDNIKGDDKRKLEPIWLEIYDLVSKGNYVSEEMSKLLPADLLKKYDNYLSSLKQIVSDSIENDKKEGVVVERDNAFYCVKCPEKSVITPAKFLSNPEFQNLDGALKFGEGNVIRTQNGQYHDMKGKVKMTFKMGDDEKIEMILSSEKAESFGKIMVHMDDKSCEIFSKYLEELEKEPRISKVVKAAKSFVQSKPPLSSMGDANVQQLQSNVESLQSSGQIPG